MQYTNTMMHVQQVNTFSESIELGFFPALSKQSLLDIRTQYCTETASTITLNCSGLESINSHGIHLLLKLLIYAKSQQKRLQIFGLSKYNHFIFEITRLSEFIDIVSKQPQTMVTVHTV